jgi:uncharacterized membrane protein
MIVMLVFAVFMLRRMSTWRGGEGHLHRFGMFLFACVMAIAALILVFVIRRESSGPGGGRYSSPIDELNARYAAGEISHN